MMSEENVTITVKKKYLELFTEICEENELNLEKELKARMENALVDSFNAYSSKCMHARQKVKFMKGGKSCKRTPGFSISNVEKMLDKLDSDDAKIEWLNNYVKQLQQTKQTMYNGPNRGLPITGTRQEQYVSLTPYMKVYPVAIQEIKKRIRELEAQKVVQAEITHRM